MSGKAGLAAAGSRSNAEVIRGVYDALAERDLGALSTVLDPDVELRQAESLPWGGTYRGLEGFERFFGAVLQQLDSVVAIDHLIEAGSLVAAVGRTRGTVRRNGRGFDVPLVHLYELRDGHVIRATLLIDTPGMLRVLNGGDG